MMNSEYKGSHIGQFNEKNDLERLVNRLYAPTWREEIC